MKGKETVELLTGYGENGVSFEFVEKTGMNYRFIAKGFSGKEEAAKLAKTLISSSDYGKVLYFSVSVDE
jgi:hypothetical protein